MIINGNEYSWEDMEIIFLGKPIPMNGVTALSYEEKKEHTNIYGRGDKPVAMGRGKREYSGSITILQSELEAIQRALPSGKSMSDVTGFDITVSYAPKGGEVTTDRLRYCRVGGTKKGMKTGDANMEIELPLVIGDIVYNV